MRILLLAATLLLAGCLDDAADASDSVVAESVAADEPACTPANTNNYGTQVQDLYVGVETWRETNGVPGLQKTVTCEGPADTRVA